MKIIIYCVCIFAVSLTNAQMNSKESVSKEIKKSVIEQSSNIWDVFKERRSVRKFKPDAVPQNDILKIIDAARTAPTSGNQQPWKFLVVTDKDKINQLKEACVNSAMERFVKSDKKTETKEQYETKVRDRVGNYFSAPVYIVVLTDNNSTYPDYNHLDGPMAAAYLMLAARALGYGTVFITDSVPDSITKEVLQIPDGYTRICLTPLGIPVEWPASPNKKKLDEFIIFDKF